MSALTPTDDLDHDQTVPTSLASSVLRRNHDHFNFSDADITFLSSDSVTFKLHRKYLEANTGAFPSAEFETHGEVVHLTEPSSVLEVMFQFVYPRRHPKLDKQDFGSVLAIAEAVEKYEVFSAMNTCETRIINFLQKVPNHAADVLAHGLKHDYPELIDEAVPHLARLPLLTVLEKLPPLGVFPWIRYQAAWDDLFKDTIAYIKSLRAGNRTICDYDEVCINCRSTMLARISELERLDSLAALMDAMGKTDWDYPNHTICSSHCAKNTCRYMPKVIQVLQKSITTLPPYTSFLQIHGT